VGARALRSAGLAVLAFALALACERGARDGDGQADRLRALGYVEWDEAADAARSGVTRHERGRAAPGYNLYTNDADEVYLMDLDGRRVHTWRVPPTFGVIPKRKCQNAELLPGGRVAVVCRGHALAVLDRDSTLVWQLLKRVHHDLAVLPDGSLLVPYNPLERRYQGRFVRFDAIAHVAADGELLSSWSTWDDRERLRRFHGPTALDVPRGLEDRLGLLASLTRFFDYYHLNAIEVLPESELGRRDARFRAGNLLVCFRNLELVAVLDPVRHGVLWRFGPGVLELPHMPRWVEGGRILLFDNGVRRGWSRVLEVEPVSGRVVWSYAAQPPSDFFSRWGGGVQRLPNGNTLVTESGRGHAFEITRAGEVVWEFWNPDIVGSRRRVIYRLLRIETGRVEPWLAGR
jgi:hypothetical protein